MAALTETMPHERRNPLDGPKRAFMGDKKGKKDILEDLMSGAADNGVPSDNDLARLVYRTEPQAAPASSRKEAPPAPPPQKTTPEKETSYNLEDVVRSLEETEYNLEDVVAALSKPSRDKT